LSDRRIVGSARRADLNKRADVSDAAMPMKPPASTAAARAAPPDPVAALNVAGIGRIVMWQGGCLWIGRDAGRALPHAHHSIQISVALDEPDGTFLFRGASSGEWQRFEAAIVLPHHPHEFDGCDGSVAHVFVEPETERGRALLSRLNGAGIAGLAADDVRRGAAELRRGWRAKTADDRVLLAASDRLIDELCGPIDARPATTPRIAAAVAFISSRIATDVSLADVAAAVHLSPSRLRHLFVEEVGTTFRGYVLWRRILHAAAAMMDGRSWTEAAHDAGFADSAHLSRTFRRMFGVSPRTLIKE
jgi:AraC family transcriptional regulator